MTPSSHFDEARFGPADALVRGWLDRDEVPAVAYAVASSHERFATRAFGRMSPEPAAPALASDAIFLIASPTKPITATAVMLLVEAGLVKLADPIARYVPGFARHGKRAITLLHALTHTSGLPDMLPENAALRARQAPLAEFTERVCALEPDFAAGRKVQYQSMGVLMLAEVVERVTGARLGDFLRERVFEPLAMHDTTLGMPAEWEQPDAAGQPSKKSRLATLRTTEAEREYGGVWNSDYWRRLGAPWGGLLSTAGDLARFVQHLLKIHRGEAGIFGPTTLEAMTRNWLAMMPKVPGGERRCHPWGLGWQLNWPTHATTFGDLLSPAAYGHWGATGTIVWLDPQRDVGGVALTTQPLEKGRRRLTNLTNALLSAIRG
ncbi:MAG: beta-lactamase family protein [Pirellulales bacterium]|nr:beta-lactamase family protein [Pirellulales bacterium]